MTLKNPPRIAAWILEHLGFGGENDALAGDLLEEFRHGRSTNWYRRQVLVAVLIGLVRLLRTQWMAIGYAILWTIPLPALYVLLFPKLMALPLFSHRWQLAWPYSTIFQLLLFYGSCFLYLWLALALYFGGLSLATRVFSLSRLWRSLWVSGSVFAVISIAQFALLALVPRHHVYVINRGSVRDLIAMSFFWAWRLPVFFSLLLSILMTLPRAEKVTRARF